MPVKKKRIFLIIKIAIIAYCLVGIALFYLQDKLLLHPQPLPADYIFKFDYSFKELNIPISKEDTVNLIRFIPADDTVAKGAVIYFHGNAGNVESFATSVKIFLDNNYEVWMPDYPGFGKSRGVISEKKLNEEAYQVKRLANRYFPDSDIIIYGRSLGTGIAAYLASTVKTKALVLEAPYYSIPDLFSSYVPLYPMSAMANYKFTTGEYLKDVACPITIFHGTDDDVIPERCAEKLKISLKPEDKFILIKDGRHNDLSTHELYKKTMNALLQ
ncbi:MAG: alpha/beta fold hydrolase [Bacteroidota bacterium]